MKPNNFISLSIILFLNCSYYYFLPERKTSENSSSKIVEAKIALIGFCGFMYNQSSGLRMINDSKFSSFFSKRNPEMFQDIIKKQRIGTSYLSSVYVALCANDFKEDIKVGEALKEIPYSGYDKEINTEKIENFVFAYMSEVKMGGQYELLEMIEIIDDKPYVRNRNVDYYVIGILEPPSRNISNIALQFTLSLVSMTTLAIFPYFEPETVHSKFLIYNRKLDLIKVFSYRNDYWKMGSWWIPILPSSEKNPYPEFVNFYLQKYYYPQAYAETDVAKFSKDLEKFLANQNEKGASQ